MGRGEGRGKNRPGDGSARRPRSWLLRHPREILLVAAIVLAALAVIGTGVDSRLDPTTLDVPGSASAEANAMLEEHFGPSAPFAILLQGPAVGLEEQGPKLVHALREEPGVTTLSPWDKGSVEGLRPTPEKALVLADFHVVVHLFNLAGFLLQTACRENSKTEGPGGARAFDLLINAEIISTFYVYRDRIFPLS